MKFHFLKSNKRAWDSLGNSEFLPQIKKTPEALKKKKRYRVSSQTECIRISEGGVHTLVLLYDTSGGSRVQPESRTTALSFRLKFQ